MSVTLSDEATITMSPPAQVVLDISPITPITIAPTVAPAVGLVVPVAGLRGSSPYEIALKHGFTGTEEEWMASLVGARGSSPYELAVIHGFTGTEAEWLESLRGPVGSGANYFGEFHFATASSQWVMAHGQNTYGLSVDACDHNGDVIEGEVDYLDANTIQITWFYPMTGTARVYN